MKPMGTKGKFASMPAEFRSGVLAEICGVREVRNEKQALEFGTAIRNKLYLIEYADLSRSRMHHLRSDRAKQLANASERFRKLSKCDVRLNVSGSTRFRRLAWSKRRLAREGQSTTSRAEHPSRGRPAAARDISRTRETVWHGSLRRPS